MARPYQDVQSASAAMPTSPTDATGAPLGLLLADMRGFRLTIQCVTPSTTLDGTGTFRCCLYSQALGAWFRNPDLDFAVGSTVAGQRGRAFPDLEILVPNGDRVYYYRDTVGVSATDNITVRLDTISRKP